MAKRGVIWADKARTDREQIIDYWRYERQNMEYAITLNSMFREATQMLAKMPSIGQDSIQFPGIKRWNIQHWVVYYKATKTNLYISRLWDTRRNPRELHI